MDAARFEQLSRLFERVIELDAGERQRVIDEACAQDPELRSQLARLLEAHDAEEGGHALLEGGVRITTMPFSPAPDPSPELGPGGLHRIGRYRVIRAIASGGMGTVYLAEQDEPRRQVAIKLLHPGLAGSSILRRFQQEAELLARLQHPSIAHVYEVGSIGEHARAQPFIAMEFIDGAPLTRYASKAKLDTDARLLLIAEIADAVEYAHQRGVVHRDLKPANILVDAQGRPRILDFGVARAVGDETRLVTMQTETGQLIGTMPYMSPEQAGGMVNQIDARADIYALGVVAFELLAGRLPYVLEGRGIHEVLRIIREDEPTRLGAVNRTLSGDVETVVAHALEKEPQRRYQSAAEFAADLRAAAKREAIRARPPSLVYRVKTFTRRHRALVAGTLAVFVALVIGIIATSRALLRALDAEELAAVRLTSVSLEAAKAREINRFLLEMLASVDPRTARDPDVRMREVLDAAAARVDAGGAPTAPEVNAAIRHTIASTYRALGAYEPARRFGEEALRIRTEVLGEEHQETLESMMELSEVLRESGDLAGAEPLAVEAMRLARAIHSEPHRAMGIALNNLALIRRAQGRSAEARELNEEALALRRLLHSEPHIDKVASLNNLALLAYTQERDSERAEALLREAIAMLETLYPDGHVYLASSLDSLASVVASRGNLVDAEALSRRSVDMRRRLLPPNHDLLGEGLSNLGFILRRQGRLDEAEPFYRESLEIRRVAWPGDHPGVATSLNNYGQLMRASGRLVEAEPLLREALEMRRRLFPGDSAIVAATAHVLGFMLISMERFDESIELIEESLAMTERLSGDQREEIATRRTSLAAAYRAAIRLDEAIPHAEHALQVRRELQGPDHAEIAQALFGLARLHRERDGEGDKALAESLLIEADEMADRLPSPPQELLDRIRAMLAELREGPTAGA
ncbi:MAG: serine/threonine protein kinase [Phycisphaeraceae bacterium]|nr:serine/threonine protein kinase [Phycisphaeraceae bacterium]